MPRSARVRLVELLAALSLAVDLGTGQAPGHVARATIVAGRLADRLGLGVRDRGVLFHLALLGWLGCIADSHEAARWFGDDIAYRAGTYDVDLAPLPFLGYLVRRAGADDPPLVRTAKRAGIVIDRGRSVQQSLRAHCQVTSNVAHRLGLDEEVCSGLTQIFARWDGRGMPAGLGGTDIALPVRLWQVADVAEVHHERGGTEGAGRVLRDRRGTALDPHLVDLLLPDTDALLGGLSADTTWDDLLGAEPTVGAPLTEPALDHALEATGDWVDLKSPWFVGHSRAVAGLAEAAGRHLGLPDEATTRLRRAGLVHGLGRVGVPNTIWDKQEPLTATETERLRLHPYYTERVLARCPSLAEVGQIAGLVHERLDGSGYHRGVAAPAIPFEARVLSAASAYRTKLEPRPHRGPLCPGGAADVLHREAEAGRLDVRAVDAVLAAAGGPRRSSGPGPGGLTPREVEVLVLIARGHTNRQAARRLGISPKTVGNHVERVYAKAGISTRAAATLFAMEHELLREP